MYFDYNLYKAYCYEGQVFCVLVFSFGVVLLVTSLVQAVRKKLDFKKALIYAFFILGYVLIVCINLSQLLHGGIYLRDEKESDAIEMQGEISNIRGLGEFSFPVVKGDYLHEEKNGYEFRINGIKCKAVLKGSLEVGDYVMVKYLPKSGYVLYISKIDRNVADIK